MDKIIVNDKKLDELRMRLYQLNSLGKILELDRDAEDDIKALEKMDDPFCVSNIARVLQACVQESLDFVDSMEEEERP
ncbi:MAG: hypothetical protein NTV82_02330 [Candidatus Aminicenantes bacterium]|nr:hypothetical protein [Candidatus Aminicenantes bacterium]